MSIYGVLEENREEITDIKAKRESCLKLSLWSDADVDMDGWNLALQNHKLLKSPTGQIRKRVIWTKFMTASSAINDLLDIKSRGRVWQCQSPGQ